MTTFNPHNLQSIKKITGDSLVVTLLTLFALILLTFLAGELGWMDTSGYLKLVIPALSIIVGIVYGLWKYQRLKSSHQTHYKIVTYSFIITQYAVESIANTEYSIYACQTTNQQTVIFHTEKLNPFNLGDSLIIELSGNKIHAIQNFSSGREVKKISLSKSLQDFYDEEFYLINKEIDEL